MISLLETERVVLRTLVEQDTDESYTDWFNDAETCAGNSHHVYPYSHTQTLDERKSIRGL